MWKTTEGSTGRLIQLCIGYFTFYVITGVTVKYFTGHPEIGFPGMKEIEFLIYSTMGGNLICLAVVLALSLTLPPVAAQRSWLISKSFVERSEQLRPDPKKSRKLCEGS